jgi:non-heme chloroperoxidase
MNRRSILTSIAAAGVGGSLIGAKSTKTAAPLKRHTGSFLETDDCASLFVRDWGAGQPVLFVHSWAMSADLWQYQMIHLAERDFRCLAFDRRGHGRSSDPGRGYTCDRLADDLAAVIEGFGLRDITLVGHSFGCGEIVRYLSRHGPGRVSRAVFVAPTLPFALRTADNPDGLDRAAVENVRARIKSDFPQWLTDNARAFVAPETSESMLEWAKGMLLQASLKAILDCNLVGLETDYRAELRKIAIPVLIIHGNKDVSAPLERTGRKAAQLIPGSRLVVYDGAPHGLMLTHMDRLSMDLVSFLRS